MTYAVPTVVAGTSGQAATASVSIARPTGVQIGDLLVLVVGTQALADTITVPAGWTPVVSELTQGNAVNLGVWTKWATHAEPATYTVTVAAADDVLYNMFLVRGDDPWDVIHVTDSAQGDAALPVAEPGIVTTLANCLAVAILLCDGSPRALVQPSGWTLLDSDDGPAGSISWGIATKAMAAAGGSGGAAWNAADGSSGDYIALTFALTPGVMGRAHSIVYAPQQLLALTLADCTEFRNLVGAADHAAAFARIWHESLPPPGAGARKYTLAELEAYRPYALVFLRDPDGLSAARQASSPGAWADRGSLWIRLVMDVPDEFADAPVLLDQLVKQLVGRLMLRPPDETVGQFFGLLDLAHETNAVGGYSYLAANDVLFKRWVFSSAADDPEQGSFIVADLEAQWGRA